jgi:hypothetical protein
MKESSGTTFISATTRDFVFNLLFDIAAKFYLSVILILCTVLFKNVSLICFPNTVETIYNKY